MLTKDEDSDSLCVCVVCVCVCVRAGGKRKRRLFWCCVGNNTDGHEYIIMFIVIKRSGLQGKCSADGNNSRQTFNFSRFGEEFVKNTTDNVVYLRMHCLVLKELCKSELELRKGCFFAGRNL